MLITYHVLVTAAPILVTGYSTVSFEEPKSESNYLINAKKTALGAWSANWVELHEGLSGFYPLNGGRDALAAGRGLAESSEKH